MTETLRTKKEMEEPKNFEIDISLLLDFSNDPKRSAAIMKREFRKQFAVVIEMDKIQQDEIELILKYEVLRVFISMLEKSSWIDDSEEKFVPWLVNKTVFITGENTQLNVIEFDPNNYKMLIESGSFTQIKELTSNPNRRKIAFMFDNFDLDTPLFALISKIQCFFLRISSITTLDSVLEAYTDDKFSIAEGNQDTENIKYIKYTKKLRQRSAAMQKSNPQPTFLTSIAREIHEVGTDSE